MGAVHPGVVVEGVVQPIVVVVGGCVVGGGVQPEVVVVGR